MKVLPWLFIGASLLLALFLLTLPRAEGQETQALKMQASISYLGHRYLGARLSADGSRIALNLVTGAGNVNVVRVYDAVSGKQLLQANSALCDAISANGARVIVSDDTTGLVRQIRVLEIKDGTTVYQVATRLGNAGFQDAGGEIVVVSQFTNDHPGGEKYEVFAANVDGIEQWRFKTNAHLRLRDLSADGRQALCEVDGDGPDPSSVFDFSQRKVVATLKGSEPHRLADDVSFLAGQKQMVGLVGNELVRWDSTTGEELKRIRNLPPLARDGLCGFAPDGGLLFHPGPRDLNVIDSITGSVLATSPIPVGAELEDVAAIGTLAFHAQRAGAVWVGRVTLPSQATLTPSR